MVNMELEKKLVRIRRNVMKLGKENRLEELTYMAGFCLGTLRLHGCPIPETTFVGLKNIIDKWANTIERKK